jgi:hypothetical protein
VEPEAEQEGLQPQLRILQRDSRRITGAAEIADGFVLGRRDVHCGEIPGPEEPSELDGVAPVGLHFVAGPPRDERRRHDLARQALPREIAIQAIAARAGLVDEAQRGGLALQATNQLVEVRLARPNLADEHRRIGPVSGRMRDGNRIFVHIQPDGERCRLRHG